MMQRPPLLPMPPHGDRFLLPLPPSAVSPAPAPSHNTGGRRGGSHPRQGAPAAPPPGSGGGAAPVVDDPALADSFRDSVLPLLTALVNANSSYSSASAIPPPPSPIPHCCYEPVPLFDPGRMSTGAMLRWLHEFRCRAALRGLADPQALDWLRSCLAGPALPWACSSLLPPPPPSSSSSASSPSSASPPPPPPATLADAEASLLAEFVGPGQLAKYTRHLRSKCVAPGQSCWRFVVGMAHKWRSASRDAPESAVVDNIVGCLPVDLRSRIRKNPTTIGELKNLAGEWDMAQEKRDEEESIDMARAMMSHSVPFLVDSSSSESESESEDEVHQFHNKIKRNSCHMHSNRYNSCPNKYNNNRNNIKIFPNNMKNFIKNRIPNKFKSKLKKNQINNKFKSKLNKNVSATVNSNRQSNNNKSKAPGPLATSGKSKSTNNSTNNKIPNRGSSGMNIGSITGGNMLLPRR
ncbi:hypothetical protein Pelo_6856 [Pelomyxa schiedti]|nr:hypothetical protein Pelo_16383 [Pelomyxa schiedti]KAH3761311.1 hypothetical protein Pelo_6856 [Pelomyxa schiedti]